jgi:hypothetical protein
MEIAWWKCIAQIANWKYIVEIVEWKSTMHSGNCIMECTSNLTYN